MQHFPEDTYRLCMLQSFQDVGAAEGRTLFYMTYCHSKYLFDRKMHFEKNKHLYYKRSLKNITYGVC